MYGNSLAYVSSYDNTVSKLRIRSIDATYAAF